MSSTISKNSMAVYEPLADRGVPSTFFPVYSQDEIQSSSVTSIGHLWEKVLVSVEGVGATITLPQALRETDAKDTLKHVRKHEALMQLLESWRKEDEQEREDTWEQLKQALDEDRISDRRLFP